MENYMIRIYTQDLYVLGISENLNQHLQKNGLSLVKTLYSEFGQCHFMEVHGSYEGDIPIDKLEVTPSEFDWKSY